MLIDRHAPEDVFARVPEVAAQTDPVLRQLDPLLDDDPLFQTVKRDLGRRYPQTLCHGRHSTPVEVILRMLNGLASLSMELPRNRRARRR